MTTRISTFKRAGVRYARPIILSASFYLAFLLRGGTVCLSLLMSFPMNEALTNKEQCIGLLHAYNYHSHTEPSERRIGYLSSITFKAHLS